MRAGLAISLFAWAALSACDGDGLAADPDRSYLLDAGFFRNDAEPGVPDVGFRERDAGFSPDATTDAGEPCVCPPLQTSCSPVTLRTPAFSPNHGALTDQLFSVLSCSDTYLHIAMYQTEWSCIVDAILAKLAADPDLQVELVHDDDQCPRVGGVLSCELARLEGQPRVALVDDARSRYMHHKFVVSDGRMVWVSSANFTRDAFCAESNDGIVVDTASVTAAYESQFQRMFSAREFGTSLRLPPVVSPPFSVYFGPETPLDSPGQWFERLVQEIDTASVSIDFLTFAWTRTEVSDAMLRAARRGVVVRGAVPALYRSAAPAMALIAGQLPLRIADVHDKLLIIDRRLVMTGSANWSENSWGNNESVLWIDDRGIAQAYLLGFERAYARGRAP